MKGYTEILSQEELNALCDRMFGLHDAILKEWHISNRSYLMEDGQHWHDITLTEGQLVIQSSATTELYLSGVTEIDLSGDAYLNFARASFHQKWLSGEPRIFLDLGCVKIATKRLFYRERPDWLGPQVRLRHEIPSLDAIPATVIEGDWRQCSNCRDAWQEAPEAQFSICPNCGKKTELT